MNRILFLLLLFSCFVGQGQEHARVYFTDKPDASIYLADAQSLFAQRALDRKERFGIPIDNNDVPVHQDYIDSVKARPEVSVMAKSKWMNCVHVFGSFTAINDLTSLPFVDRIEFADRSLNSKRFESNKQKFDNHTRKNLALQENFVYGQAQTQVYQLELQSLHQAGFTGKGLLIAVMDGGFPKVDQMMAFDRLRSNNGLLGGYDFEHRTAAIYAYEGSSHGTKVLSDMAGYIDGQFVGTAPDASYVLFKTEVIETETPVEESYWVEAVERADSLGVDLVNTSLGYSTFDETRYNYSPSEMDGNTTFISKGANMATDKGILVVNSAGNSGNDAWGVITAPADANVFAVGAVDAYDNAANFSSHGPNAVGIIKPDGMALGQGAAVIDTNDNIVANNGTSFASPIMAGAIASLWQAYPDRTNLEIMQMVRESSSLYQNPNARMGYGIPDFSTLLPPAEENPISGDDANFFPNPVGENLSLQIPTDKTLVQRRIFNLNGKLVSDEKGPSLSDTINMAHLSTGLYVLQLHYADGTLERYKFLKE